MNLALRTRPYYLRLVKGANTVVYLLLLWVTWHFIVNEADWILTAESASLSCFWLFLTRLNMNHLLTTYFDVLSRLEIVIPITIGLCLSVMSLVSFGSSHLIALHIVALIEIIGWIYISVIYSKNRHQYIVQGHGPIPRDCWVSPPAKALLPGDLILTSGRVADNLRESVGHAEMVIQLDDGTMKVFSSYMKDGTVLNPLNDVASAVLKQGHYIVLRLKNPLNAEQIKKTANIAQEMLEENRKWRQETYANRMAVVNSVPLPVSIKDWLIKICKPSGYDWLGLFMGRLAKHHWTCIGACLELYKRLGIKTYPYGTGLLGFGTTIFDPILPVRFLSDPSFRLLSTADKAAYEQRTITSSPCQQ